MGRADRRLPEQRSDLLSGHSHVVLPKGYAVKISLLLRDSCNLQFVGREGVMTPQREHVLQYSQLMFSQVSLRPSPQ